MNTDFGDKLKQVRLERNLSQEEFAHILQTTKQVISRYETKQRTPKISTVETYARLLGLPLHYFLGEEPIGPQNLIALPPVQKIPLLGSIACGQPILAEENWEDSVFLPQGMHADFCLRCQGDSMINARIFDGDLVYIRQQPDVLDGEIAAVLIENEATLKRVFHKNGRLRLKAENPTFPELEFEGEELEHIQILGKAVFFISHVQ